MSQQPDASGTLHTSPDDLFLANQPVYSHFHALRPPLKADCIPSIVVTLGGYFQRHSQRRHIL
jgi:hypothetical protein